MVILLFFAEAKLKSNATVVRSGVGNCASLPTPAEIGRTDRPSRDGFVAGLSILGSSAYRPFVQIISVNFVCQSHGTVRGTLSSVSFVAEYMKCLTADGLNCSTIVEQFQFDCLAVAYDPWDIEPARTNVYSYDSNTVSPRLVHGLRILRTMQSRIVANMSTPLVDQCGECVELWSSSGLPSAPDTHCVGMLLAHCLRPLNINAY